MLGVFVAAIAGYGSASEYHVAIQKRLQDQQRRRWLRRNNNNQQQRQQQRTSNQMQQRSSSSLQEETLQLEPIHALLFIVMASSGLMILFFFKIYNVVKVMYALGCSNAVIQVITYPLLSKVLHFILPQSNISRQHSQQQLTSATTQSSQQQHHQSSVMFLLLRERVIHRSDDWDEITNWDIIAGILGYTWGLIWLYMALFVRHHHRSDSGRQ